MNEWINIGLLVLQTSNDSVEEFAKIVVENKLVPDIIGIFLHPCSCRSLFLTGIWETEDAWTDGGHWSVNNAAIVNRQGKIWEIDVQDFDNVIDTNIKGTANILRHFIPLMIHNKQGIIVNMSSDAGRNPYKLVLFFLVQQMRKEFEFYDLLIKYGCQLLLSYI